MNSKRTQNISTSQYGDQNSPLNRADESGSLNISVGGQIKQNSNSVKFLPLKKVRKLRNNSNQVSRSRDQINKTQVSNKKDGKNSNIQIAMPAFLLGDELIISSSDISRYAKPAKL